MKEKKYNKYYLVSIILLTIIIYSKSLSNDFVNWDDTEYLNNSHIHRITFDNLKEIFNPFGHIDSGNYYHPMLFLSFSIDYLFWGKNPCGYHLTNLILFIINLLLIYMIINKLFQNEFISLITVLLCAIHPINTEVVAWITGRAILLGGLFTLLSFYFFVHHSKYYILSILSFLLALISHPFSCFLPVLLVLYVYIFSNRIKEKISHTTISILPFFLLTMTFQIMLLLLKAQEKRITSIMEMSYNKVFTPMIVFAEYLGLIVYPVRLSALYDIKVKTGFMENIIPMLVIIIFISIIIYSGKKDKELFFATGWFIVFYIPFSNIFFTLNLIMGDRYLYFSSTGIFLTFSILIYRLFQTKLKTFIIATLIILIALFSSLSYERSLIWKDSMTLWSDVIEKYPSIPLPYYNRGALYDEKGEFEKAIADYSNAIKINSLYTEAYQNRGNSYYKIKDYDRALADYQKAIIIQPDLEKPYIGTGNIYCDIREYDKAIDYYNRAIKINNNSAEAYNNKGIVYGIKKEYNNAIKNFKTALKIDPDYREAQYNLTFIYSKIHMEEKKKP